MYFQVDLCQIWEVLCINLFVLEETAELAELLIPDLFPTWAQLSLPFLNLMFLITFKTKFSSGMLGYVRLLDHMNEIKQNS